MFKIERSKKPDDFNIKNDIDLRSSTVIDYLVNDCYDKCYICEQKDFTDKEIEHIIPHQNDKKLKYDWYNLLLSCSHCNGIKGTRRIINCIEINPDEYIELRYTSNSYGFIENIKVDVKNKNINSGFLYETKKILEAVYNSNEPALTKNNSKTLRSLLNSELAEFSKILSRYLKETDVVLKKKRFEKIKELIQLNVQFAAFKRQIIRDNDFLYIDFKQAL